VIIRPETAADHDAIRKVNDEAFGDPIDGHGASLAVAHIDLFRSDARAGRLRSGNHVLRRRDLIAIEQGHVGAFGRKQLDEFYPDLRDERFASALAVWATGTAPGTND